MVKQSLVALGLMLALASTALASPVVGQVVTYKQNSSHSYPALVGYVEQDGSADLVIFNGDQYSFGLGPSSWYAWPSTYLAGVVEGTGDNRWSANPNLVLITGTSTPSLTLNGSAVQFDSLHDVIYRATVKVTSAITLTTGAAGHVDLVCDASATPTTPVDTVGGELSGSLVIGATLQHAVTGSVSYRVPAGSYCKLTSTNDVGTPTYTLVRQRAQTIGV